MTINISSPLQNVRVLDLADESGIYCGKLLAGLGAEVIRVEKPGGDPTRNIGPYFNNEPSAEKSLYFAYFNSGKKGITLELVNKDGQALFKKLTATADIIVESFPCGYLEKLKLSYASLRKINPNIICTSITPFGKTGPYKNWHANSEIVPCAMSGVMFMTGASTMPPVQLGNYLVGGGASMYAAVGTLAALHNRLFTGAGAWVDVSLQEAAASWLDVSWGSYQFPPYKIYQRLGSQALWRVPGGLFPCKDGYFFISGMGRWNLVAAWAVEVGLELGELLDPKYEAVDGQRLLWEKLDRVNKVVRDLGMKYTKQEMMAEGQKRKIPIGLVSNASDALQDPHLKARNFFVDLTHPVIGKMKYPGPLYHFAESPWKIERPAPLIGEHNSEIYGELGLTGADMAVLRAEGAI